MPLTLISSAHLPAGVSRGFALAPGLVNLALATLLVASATPPW